MPFHHFTHLYWEAILYPKCQYSWFTLKEKNKFSRLTLLSTWLVIGMVNTAICWFWLIVRPFSSRGSLTDHVIHVIHWKHIIASLWRVFMLFLLYLKKNLMFFCSFSNYFGDFVPILHKLLLKIRARLWGILIYRIEKKFQSVFKPNKNKILFVVLLPARYCRYSPKL